MPRNLSVAIFQAAVFLLVASTGPGWAQVVSSPPPEPVNPPDYQPEPPAPAPPTPDPGFGIEFRGASAFEETELREAVKEQVGGISEYGLNPARANDTAFFLTLFYLKNGYSQVRVTEQIAGNTLILNIREGPLTTVDQTTFSGNTAIDNETLRTYLLGATQERMSRGTILLPWTTLQQEALPFVEADIKTGVSRINGLYLSEGFLDVEVSEPEIRFSNDHTKASVHVSIREKTRYIIGTPRIHGHLDIFSDRDGDRVENLLAKYAGEPFTPQKVVNLRRSLAYEYKKEGYFEADVTKQADPSEAVNGVVPVTFTVNTGPLFYFDGIEITQEPDARLKESFLENRFRPLSGKVYNPEELDELFRELMQTGLFSQLRIQTKPVEENQVKLLVTAEEAKAKELGFSLGYGTFEGPFIGVTFTERNLFGTGRPLTLNAEVSARAYRGEIRYVDRWFLETQNQLRLSLTAITYDFDSYTILEVGAFAELSRNLTDHWKVAVFMRPRHGEIQEHTIEKEFLGPTSYFVNSAGISSTLDYRDSVLNPSRGFVLNTTLDVASSAIGSEVDFLRGTYRFSIYHTKGPLLFAFGARGGIVSPSGSVDDLPINERFFTGGSRSVRSFAERKLGPKDRSGDPIGGNLFQVYNAEMVFPLYGGFEGAVFFDAGSVGRSSIGDLRYALGVGIRYPLPVGPLRLDYGLNPDPKAYESSGAFHFSFGFAF